MDIAIRDHGRHKVVELSGDIDHFNVTGLKKTLFDLIENNSESIVVDLGRVDYMDSSGIGLLVTVHKKMESAGGKLTLVRINDDILDLLRVATIDRFLKIHKSLDELD